MSVFVQLAAVGGVGVVRDGVLSVFVQLDVVGGILLLILLLCLLYFRISLQENNYIMSILFALAKF